MTTKPTQDRPIGSDAQVRALVSLLADRSESVREHCADAVRELGPRAIPALRDQALKTPEPKLRVTSLNLLSDLHLERNLRRLRSRLEDGSLALETGCITLQQIYSPLTGTEDLGIALDRMAAEVKTRIAPSYPVKTAVAELAQYFSMDVKLQGNKGDYSDLRNSFLCEVLATRRGIPISLSALYLLVARRASIPLYGVNVPSHFLIGYQCNERQHFLDPFNDGKSLTQQDVADIIKRNELPLHPAYFKAASDRDIIYRMTNNIVAILERDDARELLPKIQRVRKILRSGDDE